MITKEYLTNYIYLGECINETKKKIEYYKQLVPNIEHDRVYGSSAEFPYIKRGFNIEGYNGVQEDKRFQKIRTLYNKLTKQCKELEEKKLEIELFIQDIPDISTRLMFSYLYIDGMTQEDVAKKLGIEQCTVSKRISRYLDGINGSRTSD